MFSKSQTESTEKPMDKPSVLEALKTFSLADLTEIEQAIVITRDDKKREAEQAFLAKMRAEAEADGIDLNSLLASTKGGKGKGIPMYRHPTNSNKTWAGKGRKPAWLQSFIDEGKELSEFKI